MLSCSPTRVKLHHSLLQPNNGPSTTYCFAVQHGSNCIIPSYNQIMVHLQHTVLQSCVYLIQFVDLLFVLILKFRVFDIDHRLMLTAFLHPSSSHTSDCLSVKFTHESSVLFVLSFWVVMLCRLIGS
jgi:hypothetical protein